MMTPKERVLATINHQTPDRIVTELSSTECTTISKTAYLSLKKLLGVPVGGEEFIREDMQTCHVDEEILEFLGTDLRGVPAHPDYPKQVLNDKEYIDHFGIRYRMPENGLYYDMVSHPLKDKSELEEMLDYVWPDPIAPNAVTGLREKAKKLHEENKYAIVGDITNSGIFEPSHFLRGFQNFLEDLLADEDICHFLLEHMLQYQCARWDQYLAEVGDYLDIIFFGDDLGTMQSLLMSPETYRRMIKPYQKKYFNYVKSKTHAKLMYHTCGSVAQLIPDFIEIGVDILNPVQVNAKGMDTKWLKKEYGKDICFCGSVDTSVILPHGSIDDVRAEVARRVEDLGPEGLILNSVHVLQADVPPQNIVAMYRAAKEFSF